MMNMLALMAALIALLPIRRMSYAIVVYFFISWLSGELATYWLALLVIANLYYISQGLLHSIDGFFTLGIGLLAMAGFVYLIYKAKQTSPYLNHLLTHSLGKPVVLTPTPWQEILNPFWFRRSTVERVTNISYGEHPKRNRLDIYRPKNHDPDQRLPVMIQIHGGGWIIGHKQQQALPLLYHMSERGWLCVSINYRLGPKFRHPSQIEDCKRALAWVKQHIADYGGDPNFITITGGSAGGHLTALTGLTAHEKQFQPGFEEIDTTVQAMVPIYGIYDFTEYHNFREGMSMTPFLEKLVMPDSLADHPESWKKASPLYHIHDKAPPTLIVHGSHDALAFVEEAREFNACLREKSTKPVVYAELEGAQHAFEIFHSIRASYTIRAIYCFFDHIYQSYLDEKN